MTSPNSAYKVRGREAVVYKRGAPLPSVVDSHYCVPGPHYRRGDVVHLADDECLVELIKYWEYRTTDARGQQVTGSRPILNIT